MVMIEDDAPTIAELERKNRAQRSTARKLRRAHKMEQEHSDELFNALCNSQLEAKARVAFGELWTRGGGFGCGPEDYEMIVDVCMGAINLLHYITAVNRATPKHLRDIAIGDEETKHKANGALIRDAAKLVSICA